MSSTAAPSAIDPAARAGLTDAARTALCFIVLSALFVTFTPFQTTFEGNAASGSLVNQLGYSALGALALIGPLAFCDRRVALALVNPAWMLALGWLAISALQTPDPSQTLRALAFTLFAMTAATGALCLAPNPAGFRFAIAAAVLLTLGLCFFGVVAMPSSAIHGAFGSEPQHAGLWRGIYSHKNIAGPMMALFFFVGLYLLRAHQRLAGAAIMLLSFVFVLQAGSKTAAALLPAVALLVAGGRWLGGRVLPALVIFGALVVLALATLGSVLSPLLNDIVQWVLPGTTFTGRTDLWRFALRLFEHRQWTGFGFENFWRTAYVIGAEPSRELAWDPRGSPNGHNGYLDIALVSGWPGLALAVLVLVVKPLVDFTRTGTDRESVRMADLFLMILAFSLMNAFLESFLFERANPMWVSLWLAVAGLHLMARLNLRPAPAS